MADVDCPRCGCPELYRIYVQTQVCGHTDGAHAVCDATDIDEPVCLDSPVGWRCGMGCDVEDGEIDDVADDGEVR